MGSEARFTIINGVVGGNCTFYPGYIKSTGEFVSPHLTVPLYVNHDNYGANGGQDANAKKKPSSLFELTLWGDKPCAVGAHWFTKGKKLTIRGRMESKKLQVKDNTGNLLLQIASGMEKDPVTGQVFQRGMQIPIWRWRYSFTIERFHFGEDSADANRKKPMGWNIEGTQGYVDWMGYVSRMQASQNAGFQGGDTFGLAKVGKVTGQLARKDANGQIVAISNQVAMQGQQFAQPQGQFVQNPAMMNAGGYNPAAINQAPANMAMPNTTAGPQFAQPMQQPQQFVQPGQQFGQPQGPFVQQPVQFATVNNQASGPGVGQYSNM